MLSASCKDPYLCRWWTIMVSYRAARVPLQRPGSKACCTEGSFSDRNRSLKGSDGGSSDSGGCTCHAPSVMAIVGADRNSPRPLYLQDGHICETCRELLKWPAAVQ